MLVLSDSSFLLKSCKLSSRVMVFSLQDFRFFKNSSRLLGIWTQRNLNHQYSSIKHFMKINVHTSKKDAFNKNSVVSFLSSIQSNTVSISLGITPLSSFVSVLMAKAVPIE